jgi:hypothetical protein
VEGSGRGGEIGKKKGREKSRKEKMGERKES